MQYHVLTRCGQNLVISMFLYWNDFCVLENRLNEQSKYMSVLDNKQRGDRCSEKGKRGSKMQHYMCTSCNGESIAEGFWHPLLHCPICGVGVTALDQIS